MFILFLIRFPYIGYDIRLFGAFTYIAATCMSMAVFLYFETLLRRHMPVLLKLLLSFGCIFFVIDALLDQLAGHKEHLIYFGIFLTLLQVSVILISLFRSRRDYSKIENSLIDLSILSLLFLSPFFLSDISSYGWKYLPKIGIIGGLIFAYTSMYNQSILQNRAFLLKKMLNAFAFSALLTYAMTCLVPEADEYFASRTFVLFLAVNLIFRIYYAVQSLDGDDDFVRFVEKVTESDKSTVRHFLVNMNSFFEKVDKKLLTANELLNYNPQRMATIFKKNNSHLFSLFDIRESLEDEAVKSSLSHEEHEVYEQMLDLMERFEMTYICKLGDKEPFFVMFHIPMISYTRMIFRQTLLISETIKLIEAKK